MCMADDVITNLFLLQTLFFSMLPHSIPYIYFIHLEDGLEPAGHTYLIHLEDGLEPAGHAVKWGRFREIEFDGC